MQKVRALGWEAQVRFADGLARTVDWYRDLISAGAFDGRDRSTPACINVAPMVAPAIGRITGYRFRDVGASTVRQVRAAAS